MGELSFPFPFPKSRWSTPDRASPSHPPFPSQITLDRPPPSTAVPFSSPVACRSQTAGWRPPPCPYPPPRPPPDHPSASITPSIAPSPSPHPQRLLRRAPGVAASNAASTAPPGVFSAALHRALSATSGVRPATASSSTVPLLLRE
ncbi:hypothetical protein E2562_021713, partial [Oryza meyeriana var. granulata]